MNAAAEKHADRTGAVSLRLAKDMNSYLPRLRLTDGKWRLFYSLRSKPLYVELAGEWADRMNRATHPGYWMHETTGVLRPAIEAYLAGGPMSDAQIAAMRAYLRQWIAAFQDVAELQAGIDDLTNRTAIDAWLDKAAAAGIDPL